MPHSDEMIAGVASNIDYQDGGEVQHATYWKLPGANHYLQNDQPGAVAEIVREALGETAESVVTPARILAGTKTGME